MQRYRKRAVKSFSLLWYNLYLFIPEIIASIITIVSGIILSYYTGLMPLLTQGLVAYSKEMWVGFFKENTLKLILSLMVFFIINFLVGVSMTAFKLSMVTNIIKKKKNNLVEQFKISGDYFWKIVWLRVLMFLILVIILIGIALLSELAVLFFSFRYSILIIALFIVLGLVLYKAIILFAFPLLFLKNKKPGHALAHSYIYLKKKTLHVSTVLLILALIVVLITFVFSGLSYLIGLIYVSLITATVLGYLQKWVIGLIVDLYLFLNLE